VRPDVAELALALEQALRDAPPGPARLVCLHGDVHAKNVLVHDGGAALVDLDDVAGGDAAADLGSALAGLRYGELVGRAGRESAQPLLDGYADEAPLPGVDALRWHTAAALLGERALRAVTRLRPAGLEQLDEVLAAGLEELG
jgi:Ser/Thr protein kinase RdoA (MazF antagonist)